MPFIRNVTIFIRMPHLLTVFLYSISQVRQMSNSSVVPDGAGLLFGKVACCLQPLCFGDTDGRMSADEPVDGR
jgi:hypothetical protein